MNRTHRKKDTFAGREDLVATRRYRASDQGHEHGRGYDLVFDERDLESSHRDDREYRKSRSRSPRRRSRSRERRYQRDKDVDRHTRDRRDRR